MPLDFIYVPNTPQGTQLDFIYVPNTPQGTQQINNTQSTINGNFQNISNLISINHVPFNTADDFGKHAVIDYVNQIEDPITSSDEMVLYTKSVSQDPNSSELFYRYPSNGAVSQLTGSATTSNSGIYTGGSYNAGTNPSGYAYNSGTWQYLPGNILMMSGTIFVKSNVNTVNGEFPLSSNIPEFSATPFNMVFCVTGPLISKGTTQSQIFKVTLINTKQYTLNITRSSTVADINISWIAIGV